ncbi:MAG: pyridoxal phosphate-dependent decarboxylase family protein, partial [Bacteroidales bacterium]
LKGSELADSIVIDFHKMLMTPGLNTLILFSNGQTSYSTFAQKASYLLDDEEERDWYNYARRTMECTKSMMGLNVYMQLLLGGKDLFAENIDRLYDMGKTFASMCESYKYIEVAMKPDANIVCFRFNDQSKNLDEVNKQIRNQILKNGNFYIVQTRLQGKLYLRVSIMNPLTREEDFQNLLNEVTEIGGKLRK